jgi:hypothetical protein
VRLGIDRSCSLPYLESVHFVVSPRGRTQKGKIGTLTLENEKLTLKDTHCPDSLPHSRKEHSQGLNNNAVVLSLVQRNFQRLVPFLFALGPRGDTIRSGTRAHCADHFSHRRQDIKLVTFTSSLAGALVKT